MQQPSQERGGTGSSEERRLKRKQLQQLEADRFPTLGFRRADVQVRNKVKMAAAPGIDNPQSKDCKLVVITYKECAEERFNVIETLERRSW